MNTIATHSDTLLLIDKPVGCTSFDVIRCLRKELGIRKMGHAGTLDPLASGLLLIGVGPGTKALHALLGLPKTYLATIQFGYATDTGDTEGAITSRGDASGISEQLIRTTLQSMIGTLSLPAPTYSAIKQNGVPLYKRARRGEVVHAPLRDMTIYEATLQTFEATEYPRAHICFYVASGVYIRSLAEELGKRVGCPAHLSALRRTAIGSYAVEQARSISV